jgi:hypothetical protein
VTALQPKHDALLMLTLMLSAAVAPAALLLLPSVEKLHA